MQSIQKLPDVLINLILNFLPYETVEFFIKSNKIEDLTLFQWH